MDEMDIFDSATGQTLMVEKRVFLEVGNEPILLLYTTAKRGRICQVRRGSFHIHYFIDEPDGRQFIIDDETLNRVSLDEIIHHAPDTTASKADQNGEG